VEDCASCSFDQKWKQGFLNPATRPALPRYIIEMFIDARVQAVTCTASALAKFSERVDMKDRGLVLAHYTEPLQIPHVKQYQYLDKSMVDKLVCDTDQNEAFLAMQQCVEKCNHETHFAFVVLIGDLVSAHTISRHADRQFMRAVHVASSTAATSASKDNDTATPATDQPLLVKPMTLADRLNAIRWCCQEHFLQDPRTAIGSRTTTTTTTATLKHTPSKTQMPMVVGECQSMTLV